MAKSGKSRSKKDDTPESAEQIDDSVILPREEEPSASETSEHEQEAQDDQEFPDETDDSFEPADQTDAVSDPSEISEEDATGEGTSDDLDDADDAENAVAEEEYGSDRDDEVEEYSGDAEVETDESDAVQEDDEYPQDDYGDENYEEAVEEPVPSREVVVQKVGLIPLILGGAIAAGLGYVLAFFYYGQPGADFEAMISAQADRIGELEAQVASLPAEQPNLDPLVARIDDAQMAQTTLAERLDVVSGELSAQIAAFDERLNAVERAPAEDGTLAETAIASWERELDALREQFVAQEAEMQALTSQAQADLEAARAEAEEVEQSAAEAAQAAMRRAALARVQAALDSGSAFDAALADLQSAGAEVPPELAAVATEGAPTIAALREEFPGAARGALSVARSEGLADDGANPLTAFLREQLDVRSVEPREGDDPDAILSRVEAALADNRLTDALAEIATLPEVVRAEMSGWIELATARADALAAAETIDQSLSN